MNPQRLDILLAEYLKTGKILDPAQVAYKEKVLLPYKVKGMVVGYNKVFENYEEFKRFIIAKELDVVYLIYEEFVNSEEMVSGFIQARSQT